MFTKTRLENERKRLANVLMFAPDQEADSRVRMEIERIDKLLMSNQFKEASIKRNNKFFKKR